MQSYVTHYITHITLTVRGVICHSHVTHEPCVSLMSLITTPPPLRNSGSLLSDDTAYSFDMQPVLPLPSSMSHLLKACLAKAVAMLTFAIDRGMTVTAQAVLSFMLSQVLLLLSGFWVSGLLGFTAALP